MTRLRMLGIYLAAASLVWMLWHISDRGWIMTVLMLIFMVGIACIIFGEEEAEKHE